jgi:elongation factor 3
MAPIAAATPAPVTPADLKAGPPAGSVLASLFVADKGARRSAAEALASRAKNDGVEAFESTGFTAAIVQALADKKSPAAREGAASAISVLVQQGAIKALEPFVIGANEDGVFNQLLETFADKMPAVRQAALDAVRDLAQSISPWAVGIVLPALLRQTKSAGKWQVKTGSLATINQLITSSPSAMAKLTPDLIPVLAEAIWDTKADVKKAARETLTKSTALISNKDVERFIPALISALINPVEEVPATIQLLGSTTFVSEVDAPTLSLMAPLLQRGLNERPTATKRKVAVIIDNMSKLVDNEYTVRPFVPKLLPGLIKIQETVSDPEARGVVVKAIATLRQTANVPTGDGSDLPPLKMAEAPSLAASVVEIYKKAGATTVPSATNTALSYASKLAANLVNFRNFEVPDWEAGLTPYLELVTASPDPKEIARQWLLKSASETTEDGDVADDEEEGEDLCNCTFSLAYGAKILLNTATLRLKRGHRYGLCGRNGSGKVRAYYSVLSFVFGGLMAFAFCSVNAHARHHQRPSRGLPIPRGSSYLLRRARYRRNGGRYFCPRVYLA